VGAFDAASEAAGADARNDARDPFICLAQMREGAAALR
jgi:hypothetical protein